MKISMFVNFRKSLLILIILLITPLIFLTINWRWQPELLNNYSYYFYWLTETAGSPWSIITCIFFSLIMVLCLKIRSKNLLIKLILILAVAIVAGQIIKSGIKNLMAEPRPYVLWMADKYQINDKYFYSLPRMERQALLQVYLQSSSEVPNWLYQHWQKETGYSFPSGHTLLAVTWAFIAFFLLSFRRFYLIIGLIIAWAILVQVSRFTLGMHHPIDVICSTFIGWLIALFTYSFGIERYVFKNKQ